MTVHAALLTGLKYVAVIEFMFMGSGLIIARVDQLQATDRLAKVEFLLRFIPGTLVIVGYL